MKYVEKILPGAVEKIRIQYKRVAEIPLADISSISHVSSFSTSIHSNYLNNGSTLVNVLKCYRFLLRKHSLKENKFQFCPAAVDCCSWI